MKRAMGVAGVLGLLALAGHFGFNHEPATGTLIVTSAEDVTVQLLTTGVEVEPELIDGEDYHYQLLPGDYLVLGTRLRIEANQVLTLELVEEDVPGERIID